MLLTRQAERLPARSAICTPRTVIKRTRQSAGAGMNHPEWLKQCRRISLSANRLVNICKSRPKKSWLSELRAALNTLLLQNSADLRNS
jgi:hypothetical protein